MTIAPPRSPQHEGLEAVIREARARQRHRRNRAIAAVAALAGAALAVWAVVDAVSGSSSGSVSLTPVVNSHAFAGHGYLAFVSRDRLWLLDGKSGRLVRVAGAGASSPSFSPDGRWLAWSQGPRRFGVARSDGTGPRFLSSHGAAASWLPAGQLLVGRAVYRIEDGVPVRTGSAPAGLVSWTPDGSRYAFVTARPNRHRRAPYNDVERVELSRSLSGPRTVWYETLESFTTRSGWEDPAIGPVAILPKGGILVWLDPFHSASIAADGLSVYEVRSPLAHPRKLGVTLGKPLSLGAGGRFALGAGGDRIAWTRKQVVTCTPERCVPLRSQARLTLDPAWSPDGRTLAYVTGADLGDVSTLAPTVRRWYRTRRLWIGGRPVRDSTGAASPVWSANGRNVLFVSRDALWLLPRIGARPVRVAAPLFWPRAWPNYYGEIDWGDQFAWQSRS